MSHLCRECGKLMHKIRKGIYEEERYTIRNR
jgi:hypothetical protein